MTPQGSFTAGAEGPACDRDGCVYAVGFGRDDTIGCVAPGGAAEPFVQLPAGSIGNGIRVRRDSAALFVADYTGHNILAVDLPSGVVEVWAHEPTLHQPNDIAITADDVLYASDPSWEEGTGRVWRIGADRRFRLVADAMGTTNGIEVAPDGTRLYVNESAQRMFGRGERAACSRRHRRVPSEGGAAVCLCSLGRRQRASYVRSAGCERALPDREPPDGGRPQPSTNSIDSATSSSSRCSSGSSGAADPIVNARSPTGRSSAHTVKVS